MRREEALRGANGRGESTGRSLGTDGKYHIWDEERSPATVSLSIKKPREVP